MKNIFINEDLIAIGCVISFFLLIYFIGALWVGIGFIGFGLAFIGLVLFMTNWCAPGSCNGMFFIPGILSIFVGLLLVGSSLLSSLWSNASLAFMR